jgi:hypothetical protein
MSRRGKAPGGERIRLLRRDSYAEVTRQPTGNLAMDQRSARHIGLVSILLLRHERA